MRRSRNPKSHPFIKVYVIHTPAGSVKMLQAGPENIAAACASSAFLCARHPVFQVRPQGVSPGLNRNSRRVRIGPLRLIVFGRHEHAIVLALRAAIDGWAEISAAGEGHGPLPVCLFRPARAKAPGALRRTPGCREVFPAGSGPARTHFPGANPRLWLGHDAFPAPCRQFVPSAPQIPEMTGIFASGAPLALLGTAAGSG